MPNSVNKVFLIGTLGQDPEILPKGGLKLSVATNSSYFDTATKQFKKNPTDWHKCICWGKTAEIYANKTWLRKGVWVQVDGKIKTNEYMNKQGQKVRDFQIDIEKLGMHEKAKDGVVAPEEPELHYEPIDDVPF